MPNLNNRAYLPERLQSLYAQTLADWELIIVDNYSDDGAWEFFQEEAGRDSRIQIAQAPRQGMYANWNNCLKKATGEFVYIATSDDSLAVDCLEQLVNALDGHPNCDVAHCNLRVIDEVGRDHLLNRWWREDSLFARSSGRLLDQPHIRLAPYDGLLHLGSSSVYISITQLLIRRSLFDRIGMFEPEWGSLGDYHWNMKAGLTSNTVHVPTTWGGWRVHPLQATNELSQRLPKHRYQIESMIDHAIGTVGHLMDEKTRSLIRSQRRFFYQQWKLEQDLSQCRSRWEKLALLIRQLLKLDGGVLAYALVRLGFYPQGLRRVPLMVERWLAGKQHLVPISTNRVEQVNR